MLSRRLDLKIRDRYWRSLLVALCGFFTACAIALFPLQGSVAIPVSSVLNPRVSTGLWVMDAADMLSPESEQQLNQRLANLESANGVEMAVVTVPDTQPSSSPKVFATELFNMWGLGKAGADNGVLFLVSKGDRRTEVETGYGLEAHLTEAHIQTILREQVTPHFKAGDFDAGVLAGVGEIALVLSDAPPAGTFVLDAGIRDFFAVVWSPVWGMLTAIAVAIFALLKMLIRGYRSPIHIGPTGRSRLIAPGKIKAKATLWVALDWIMGADMVRAKGLVLGGLGAAVIMGAGGRRSGSSATGNSFLGNVLSLLSFFKAPSADKSNTATQFSATQHSQLVAIRRREDLLKSACQCFGLLLLFAVISVCVLKAKAAYFVLVAFLWLGAEMWLNLAWLAEHGGAKQENISLFPRPAQLFVLVVIKLFKLLLSIFVISLVLFSIVSVAAVALLPFLVTASVGTFAALLRLVRSLPAEPIICCQACDRPMQQLNATHLRQHLRKAEATEIKLGNTFYEGWRCPTCALEPSQDSTGEKSLSIHLFSQVVNPRDYEHCFQCDALTAKVTTMVVTKPTTTTTGKTLIQKDCQCCGKHQKAEVVRPKLSASSSMGGGYSSDTGSRDYGSASSGGFSFDSGGGGGSSSFGGGESGGGGAGDSW